MEFNYLYNLGGFVPPSYACPCMLSIEPPACLTHSLQIQANPTSLAFHDLDKKKPKRLSSLNSVNASILMFISILFQLKIKLKF